MPHQHRRVYAHAKLNLLLNIGERVDRLHTIESVIQAISLADVIDFFVMDRAGFRVDFVDGGVAGGDTLIRKALEVLAEEGHCDKGMAVAVQKRIPEGAGLGGGSADAAAALVAANELWNLHLPLEKLRLLSRAIGSDVGYFLDGGTCKVTGTGEIIEKLAPLPKYYAVICYPGFPISSANAYRWWDDEKTHITLSADEAIARLRAGQKPQTLINAFHPVLTQRFPIIGNLMAQLEEKGAFWTGITGSGSAVYGVFMERESAVLAGLHIRASEWCEVYIARFVENAIEEGTE
jgi:4-diphosphocytidyl-2-C-methyl-D-erythritol kinase